MSPICKHNIHRTEIATNASVQSYIGKGDEITIKCELIAFHIVRRNWRVMTCLLIIDWDPSDISLESFSQKGIKRLLHNNITADDINYEPRNMLQLLDW